MTAKSASAVWDGVLARLWTQSRFASYFYQFADLAENRGIPTLALAVLSRRFCLFYNPDFVLRTEPDHLIGLLVHEMLHQVLNHQHRMLPGREVHLQNLAQDMVINSYLHDNCKTFFARKGFQDAAVLSLPPGLPTIPEAFRRRAGRPQALDVTWEKVYAWLEEHGREMNPTGEDGPASPAEANTGTTLWSRTAGDAAALPFPEGLTFTDGAGQTLPTGVHLFTDREANEHADAGRKRVLRFVRNKGECAGERLYTDLSALMEEPRPSQIAWLSRILSMAKRMSSSIRWEHAFSRFNKRYFDAGIYTPGRVYAPRRLITVAVDVSGSMAAHPGRIETAFSIVERLAEKHRISLVCVDQQLFVPTVKQGLFRPSDNMRPYFYRKGDWKFVRSGTRGATFFAALFDPYMKGHRELLIVLTDGHVYDLDVLRPYSPTLWVVPPEELRAFAPPFGRVLAMESLS